MTRVGQIARVLGYKAEFAVNEHVEVVDHNYQAEDYRSDQRWPGGAKGKSAYERARHRVDEKVAVDAQIGQQNGRRLYGDHLDKVEELALKPARVLDSNMEHGIDKVVEIPAPEWQQIVDRNKREDHHWTYSLHFRMEAKDDEWPDVSDEADGDYEKRNAWVEILKHNYKADHLGIWIEKFEIEEWGEVSEEIKVWRQNGELEITFCFILKVANQVSWDVNGGRLKSCLSHSFEQDLSGTLAEFARVTPSFVNNSILDASVQLGDIQSIE